MEKLQELGKVRIGVVGPGSCLRVILNREYRMLTMPDAFHGAVIEVAMRDLEFRRPRHAGLVADDRKTVILRGDHHLAAGQVANRMVPAPVPVRHLLCLASIRKANQLMAETDAKDRESGVTQFTYHWKGVLDGGRVSRAVGEEDAVRIELANLTCSSI